MPHHVPSLKQQAPSASSAAPASRFGSFRTGSLVLFTFWISAVALIGPNEIHQWLFPVETPAAASDGDASTSFATLYGSDAPFAAAAAVPELASEEVDAIPAIALNASDGHAADFERQAMYEEPGQTEPAAEVLLREPTGGGHDRMQQIQQRLQLLGAQYMMLETWGDVVPRYRFYCRMPPQPSSAAEYEFTSNDPLEAMQRVLGQIEARIARR